MKNIDHDSPMVTITSKKEPISLFVHWYPYISCVGTVKKKNVLSLPADTRKQVPSWRNFALVGFDSVPVFKIETYVYSKIRNLSHRNQSVYDRYITYYTLKYLVIFSRIKELRNLCET